MYQPIIEALRRQDGEQALAAATALVAQHPHDAHAHRWLSAAQQMTGDRDAALASIEQAISLAPEDADLYVARAGLLIGARQHASAQASLAQASQLDPNQFQAYLLQAQLALGQGRVEDAQRQITLAGKVHPEHPQLASVQAMVLLRQGRKDEALKVITQAIQRLPEDLQLRHTLGFVYMESGHLAFAEQAFRGIVEQHPTNHSLRGLIAELVRRQGRPQEAAQILAPLLQDEATATPGIRSFAGQLHLAAGDVEQALPLLTSVLAVAPGHRPTLTALVFAWQRSGQQETGRNTLEAALATHPHDPSLWLARLALEEVGSEQALAVASRWVQADPQSLPALEAQMAAHGYKGDVAAAETVARELIAREPAHKAAHIRIFNNLLARDPGEAAAYVQVLLQQAPDEQSRPMLLDWLATAQYRAGEHVQAVEQWSERARIMAPRSLPMHPLSRTPAQWPALAEVDAGNGSHPILLWGAPGSGVERIATLLAHTGGAFRSDRFSDKTPQDGFQTYDSIAQLAAGNADPAALIESWRAELLRRGIKDGNVIDWLVWWDQALLQALRPHVPEGLLLVVLRDPRDMLLEWLAFGAPSYMAMPSPLQSAQWLAAVLGQIADLDEANLYPHVLLRLDGIENNPQAIAASIGGALGGLTLPAPASVGPAYFPAGHWREYTTALAEPFAVLAPVAARLGYPLE
ncbi:tetratricopeptide repeat protein [Pseudoxanthomonas dokdonensis]|uniref:Uncharacterized protein n=1 Tax=Pseudoxanthomonas dokdonensis TaxID=344882 RepID=A0A0R0CPT8_9GAMM|nr:tetratricopeptide repeat protein [Pseudoxanthomonas dokdonensis]KRG71996.1 hypothetical protein ABB29_00585 [Pseudoxanthomonas dokdonensis]